MSFMVPPTEFSWEHAFVYHSPSLFQNKREKNYILFNNILNGVSYFLSPLVGLIRITVNAYFLFLHKNATAHKPEANDEFNGWSIEERCFLKAQIARGAFELIGGGYLLWIPDLIATINPDFGVYRTYAPPN